MHGNNEIGNILNIEKVAALCKFYKAIFHSDCVQTVGHYPLDLSKIDIDFISASGHKFHGPKGVGVLYINKNVKAKSLLWGGGQERNRRAGTENVYGIVGFAKALELSIKRYEADRIHIEALKIYMIGQLINNIEGVSFNGDAEGNSLYSVLSVSFPKTEKSSMLLFHLDQQDICASGGSACTSGEAGSHVMRALYKKNDRTVIRFSFSRHNTRAQIDETITVLKRLLKEESVPMNSNENNKLAEMSK
jgi:cysteine desulfurase